MQFPHISDTSFPNLNTVNVYQLKNTFDYYRWNEKTKIKLCNVIWNSDYSDVVVWDTNEARDNWFDSIEDFWSLELQTLARVVPEGFVKLPIPYDVMARYNYLFVDMPIATSADNPIDYENTDGIRRWYFFINNIQYLAPNATQVYVNLDVWTNFQNDVDIKYMLLERGHAPVAYSDTEKYLADPISNNRYLLAPDVNYDNAGITRSSSYVPFGNGTKYVCIASTCSQGQIPNLGEVVDSDVYVSGGEITYSDTGSRWGTNLHVDGFGFGNGRDFSGIRTPVRTSYSDGRIANNLTVYAIEATECYGSGTFFQDVLHNCPQFLTTVQACFVVDEGCINLGSSYEIAGHTVYHCIGKSSTLLQKSLTIADFAYPKELQRFAKLYTAPYAQLEITDNDGTTYTVNIEETSTLSVKSVVSIAFPYINERVYIEGIGGKGSRAYSWVDLKGNSAQLNMPNSDWFQYCFDWNIPTFALFMDGLTAYMLENFNRAIRQGRNQALVNYHTTMRGANNAYENACDQADTAYTNTTESALTARDNAYRSADTGKVNADNNADTAHTNTYNDAELSYRTLDRVCTTQKQNLVTANTATAANEETGIVGSSSITNLSNTLSSINTDFGNRMVYHTTDANIEKATATNVSSNVGTILTSALSSAQAGIVMGGAGGATIGATVGVGVGSVPGWAVGALGGAVVGGVGGIISAAVNDQNVGITTNTSQTIADAQVAMNSNNNAASMQTASDITDVQNDVRRVVYRTNANSSVTQMDNSNATSRTNGDDARTTTKTNADNAMNTQKTNATNTKNTSRSNAADTYNNVVANASRTRSNVKSNSGYTRRVAEANAQEILENSRNDGMFALYDARNVAPIEVCQYSGNPQADYMRTRGVQIKVKTQSDSAIRQTGDTFARFGYALNQVWNVSNSGLQPMKYFTYWKASDIWVDDRASSNNSVNAFIQNMFLNGVTVWSDPTKIGKINVYDN